MARDSKKQLPWLRKELLEPSHAPIFYYDGASWLFKLSQTHADRLLVLRVLSNMDLRGLDGGHYVELVHWFAVNGYDTREAAFNILKYPAFQAHLPDGGLTLKQDYAFICMLFPMKESVFTDDLVQRMAHELDKTAQRSLLQALWYVATPETIAVLRKTVRDSLVHAKTRAYAQKLLDRVPKSFPGEGGGLSNKPLRAARRQVMQKKVSDDALIEFVQLTKEIMEKQ